MKYVCVLATAPDNVAMVVAAVAGVLILGWVWRVHTDLTNRRERLRGLVANIKTAHGEVTAVENIGVRHAYRAGSIEHRQRRTVARPKRGAGGFIDNVQYPDAGALTAVNVGQQPPTSKVARSHITSCPMDVFRPHKLCRHTAQCFARR